MSWHVFLSFQPPICDVTGYNIRRRRRRSSGDQLEDIGNLQALRLEEIHARDRSVEVFSGLYVSEVDEQKSNGKALEHLTTFVMRNKISSKMSVSIL